MALSFQVALGHHIAVECVSSTCLLYILFHVIEAIAVAPTATAAPPSAADAVAVATLPFCQDPVVFVIATRSAYVLIPR